MLRKTSVYLSDDEVDALRDASESSGLSQAELIREGVRRVVASYAGGGRLFHSMGAGRGSAGTRSWTAEELLEKIHGER